MSPIIRAVLKTFATPPSFPDEEKTQTARALHILLWTMVIVATLLWIAGFLFPMGASTRWVATAIFVYLQTAGLFFLNLRGKTTLSSWLFITTFTALITILAYTGGGINAPAIYFYIVIIFIAGLLLGGRVGIIVAAFCTALSLGFVVLEQTGNLPQSVVPRTALIRWIALVLFIIAIVSLQYLASVSVRNALRKTQKQLNERIRVEKALQEEVQRRRESEQKARAIFDRTFEFVGMLKPDGTLIEANNTALEFAGIASADVLGKPFWETPWWTHSTETAEKIKEAVLQAAGGSMVRFETEHIAADGTVHSIDFSLKPIFSDDGKVSFLIPEGRDITDRKRAEEALKKSEAHYRTLAENTPDVVAVFDKEGKYIFVNSSIVKVSSLKPEEFIGKKISDVGGFTQEQAAYREKIIKEIFQTKKPFESEFEFLAPTGTFFYEWRAYPVFDTQGNVISVFSVNRDITGRKKAEKILRESEERYRTLIAAVPDFIVQTDLEGHILFVNETRIPLLGYFPKEQILGKNILSFIAEDERARAVQNFNRMFKESIGLREYTLEFEDGIRLHCEVNGELLRDANNQPYNIVFVVRDISDRKKSEEAMKEMQERYQAAVEQSNDGITIADTTGRYVMVNKAFCSMVGYSKEELLQMSVEDLMPERNQSSLFRQISTENMEGRRDGILLRKNGSKLFVSVTGSLLTIGNQRYVQGIVQDITERKRIEEALRERLKEMTCLSEVSHDISLQLSTDELCAKIIDHLIPAMQYPDVTVPFIILDEKKFSTERYNPNLACGLQSSIVVKGKMRGELWVYYTEERDFLIPYEQNLLNAVAQELSRWIERTEVEEQARRQQLQLLQADKMTSLGVLVSGVAHEINNPNNLVMFNSDLIAQVFKDMLPALDEYYASHPDQKLGGLPYKETRKEMEGMLNGITIGAQRIRDIVAGLKEFARVDPGNLNQEVHVNDVVKSALLIVGNLIRKSTDNFTVEYDDRIQSIKGNIQQIEQALINLLTNACQALPDRTRSIRLHTLHDHEAKQVKVIVSDEGIGMSAEVQQRLFDPFFTTKRDQGGTGLGLSVTYNIVQAHHGKLQVESEEGKGTTITLSLPGLPEETTSRT